MIETGAYYGEDGSVKAGFATRWASVGVRALRDFLVPPVCAGCGVPLPRGAFCVDCWGRIPFVSGPVCERCGLPLQGPATVHSCQSCVERPPAFGRARGCTSYDRRLGPTDPVSDLLLQFKYGRNVGWAPLLGRLLAEHGPLAGPYDLLIPVPLHVDRLRWRGFNQSVLLGREVARFRGLRFEPLLLRKPGSTERQVGLADEERRRNVRGAFRVEDRSSLPQGARVLLVDDVLTTGATAHECARVLRRAGAQSVDVLVLCRVP